MPVIMNGLTFRPTVDGGFICDDLQEIPRNFDQRYQPQEIQKVIDEYIALLRQKAIAAFPTKAEHDAMPEGERQALGRQRLETVLLDIEKRRATCHPSSDSCIGSAIGGTITRD